MHCLSLSCSLLSLLLSLSLFFFYQAPRHLSLDYYYGVSVRVYPGKERKQLWVLKVKQIYFLQGLEHTDYGSGRWWKLGISYNKKPWPSLSWRDKHRRRSHQEEAELWQAHEAETRDEKQSLMEMASPLLLSNNSSLSSILTPFQGIFCTAPFWQAVSDHVCPNARNSPMVFCSLQVSRTHPLSMVMLRHTHHSPEAFSSFSYWILPPGIPFIPYSNPSKRLHIFQDQYYNSSPSCQVVSLPLSLQPHLLFLLQLPSSYSSHIFTNQISCYHDSLWKISMLTQYYKFCVWVWVHSLARNIQLHIHLHHLGCNIHEAGMFTTQHIFDWLSIFLKDVLNESDVLQYVYVFMSFPDRTSKSLTNMAL